MPADRVSFPLVVGTQSTLADVGDAVYNDFVRGGGCNLGWFSHVYAGYFEKLNRIEVGQVKPLLTLLLVKAGPHEGK